MDIIPQNQPMQTARPIEDNPVIHKNKNAFIELVVVFAVLYFPDIVRVLFFGRSTQNLYKPLGAEQYLAVFTDGLLAVILISFICYKNNLSLKSVGLHMKKLWGEILTAGAVLAGVFVLLLITSYMLKLFLDPDQLQKLSDKNQNIANMFASIPWAMLIPFCLFVGLYEELVFRGFLITRLTVILNSKWLALILSSVIFGLAHLYQGPLSVLMITVLAMILGTLFILRKSLISAIIVHAAFDLFFLTMVKLQH